MSAMLAIDDAIDCSNMNTHSLGVSGIPFSTEGDILERILYECTRGVCVDEDGNAMETEFQQHRSREVDN
jgi:hypothetical protein